MASNFLLMSEETLASPSENTVTTSKLTVADKNQSSSLAQIPEEQKQFLQIGLNAETEALLSTDHLTEVLTISADQITPMPHMSPWIMGTYNWRGQILWLADLGCLIGLKPLHQQVLSSAKYTAAVIQLRLAAQTFNHNSAANQVVGLVVNRVGNIERCSSDSIQPSSLSEQDSRAAKFLQGYWLNSQEEILAVLEPDAILKEIFQA